MATATQRLPPSTDCRTAHSLAYRAIGYRYRSRLETGGRVPIAQWTSTLGCHPFEVGRAGRRVRLSEDQVAALVRASIRRFVKSSEAAPNIAMAEVPPTADAMTATAVRAHTAPLIERAWRDLCDPDGKLPITHDDYLKFWQLSGPHLPCDYFLFDESQDADPVMLAVLERQPVRRIYVGDRYQAIYEWRGAINAMESVTVSGRAWLTQTWRFGPRIAIAANVVLSRLRSVRKLVGAAMPSSLGRVERPNAILCRTNAAAIGEAAALQGRGVSVSLAGNTTHVLHFADAAERLMNGGRPTHPDLCGFDSWQEVLAYAETEEVEGEFALLVNLVRQFGGDALKRIIRRCVPESQAHVHVSTAHRAKGREWNTVALAPDFRFPAHTESEELRLLYVAVTRGRSMLDPYRCPDVAQALDGSLSVEASGPERPRSDVAPVQESTNKSGLDALLRFLGLR